MTETRNAPKIKNVSSLPRPSANFPSLENPDGRKDFDASVMPVSAFRSDSNIQENIKTTRTGSPIAGPPPDLDVMVLADLLRSPGPTGEVLRVLIGRLRDPRKPYTSKELEVLLLLTLALVRAGMWP